MRAIDVTKPLGVTLMGGPQAFVDPLGTATTVVNHMVNFGWEFVWHCHILSHEEMDMMHALSFAMAPRTPTNLTVTELTNPFRVRLNWTNAAANATGFVIQRATDAAFTQNLVTFNTAGVVTIVYRYGQSSTPPGITTVSRRSISSATRWSILPRL